MEDKLAAAYTSIQTAKREQFIAYAYSLDELVTQDADFLADMVQETDEMETMLRKQFPYVATDASLAAALGKIRAAKCQQLVAYSIAFGKRKRVSAAALKTAHEIGAMVQKEYLAQPNVAARFRYVEGAFWLMVCILIVVVFVVGHNI